MSRELAVHALPVTPSLAELFNKEHSRRMSDGIWQYGALLSMVTAVQVVEQDGENVIWGRVSGRRHDLEGMIMDRVTVHITTCRRYLQRLESWGYIHRFGEAWDFTIAVRISPLPMISREQQDRNFTAIRLRGNW